MKLQPYQDFFQSGIIQIFAAFLVFCGIFWLTTLSWPKPINIVDSIGIKNPAVASAEPIQAVSYKNLDELPLHNMKRLGTLNNSYEPGQCTFGVKSWNPEVGDNWGNAKDWGYAAMEDGWTVSDTPQVGAVAWSSAGYYGHVALVVGVGDGEVTIREMNYDYIPFHSRTNTVPTSNYRYIF